MNRMFSPSNHLHEHQAHSPIFQGISHSCINPGRAHHSLRPGRINLRASGQASGHEIPSQEAWFWATGKQGADCGLSRHRAEIARSTLPEGLRGGSSKTLWSIKPIVLRILPSTTSREGSPSAFRVHPMVLGSFLHNPHCSFSLSNFSSEPHGTSLPSYLQLHTLTETWLSPWTQPVSCNCSLSHTTHPPRWGWRPGTKGSPSRSLFLYLSIGNLASGKASAIWICFPLHPLIAPQMVERTNFSISAIYQVINVAVGINPT